MNTRSPLVARWLVPAAMALMLVACTAPAGGGSPSTVPSEQASGDASGGPIPSGTPPNGPTASAEPSSDLGPFSCTLPLSGGSADRSQITDVRVGEHDGYDRVVIEFDGGVPHWTLSPATPPYTRDPSGLEMNVQGSAVWRLVLDGGTAVAPDGSQTYTGETDFVRDYAKLAELVEAGDFEAVSTWYIGVRAESCARVLALDGPARLVVDIEH